MAFDRDNLVRLGGANSGGKACWLYSSADDAAATINGSDYFLDAINELKLGDWILVNDSSAVHTVTFVKTNNGTTIDTASGTAIGDV